MVREQLEKAQAEGKSVMLTLLNEERQWGRIEHLLKHRVHLRRYVEVTEGEYSVRVDASLRTIKHVEVL